MVRLHKGVHQAEHLERLLRVVRVRPGNLDLYLEIVGLEQVRRAIYRAAPSLRVRYDDRLCLDLENAVGPASSACSATGGPPRGSMAAPPPATPRRNAKRLAFAPSPRRSRNPSRTTHPTTSTTTESS